MSRMSMIAGRGAALGVVLVCEGMLPNPAGAQKGFQLRPSLTATQVHDSNIFFTSSDRVADFVTRVTPVVESEYRSTTWTLKGRYTFDAERFTEHPELSSMGARRHALAGVEYRPTRRLTLAADGELLSTQTPGDLNLLTGFSFTRARADRIAAHSSITRQLHRLTSGTIDYTFSEDRLAGAVGIHTHAATVGAEHHISSRDIVKVKSSVHQFAFGSHDTGTVAATSLALTLGWTRALARDTDIAVDGGPGATNGAIAPELSGVIRFRFDSGSVSFAYARTQATIIGLAGTADTQSATAAATWSPRRSLQIAVSPAFVRSRHASAQANVYRLTLDASHAIGRSLSVAVAGVAHTQNGDLYARLAGETIQQENIMIKIIAQPGLHAR
jgi:hypothetical protein